MRETSDTPRVYPASERPKPPGGVKLAEPVRSRARRTVVDRVDQEMGMDMAPRRRRVVVALAVAVLLAVAVVIALRWGADDDPAAGFARAATEYDGPLNGVDGRYGAAGDVVDCRAADGGAERDSPYAEGATSESVKGALETAYSEGLFLSLPEIELTAAATESDRVLLTYAPAGTTVAALVFRDGPATEGAGGPGWYLESWARCDFSDFPARDAAALGYQIWRDADGDPVPVTTLTSGPGPEHCSWDHLTFLYLDDDATYVRAPDRSVRGSVEGVYSEGLPLPADAVPTGFRRAGQQLWRTRDGDYVYVGTPDRVEVWPRFVGGCA